MALTRLGWDVITSGTSPRLVNFPWVTGKVRGGDHFVVLDYIARRWNAEVQKITKAHSWAWANRPVRGGTAPSEHAAGIALDFDAPDFPIGVPTTKVMTARQIAAVRQIIKDLRGAARWGGEWDRPDAMHVELQGGNALVKEVADQIRAGKLPEPGKVGDVKPAGKPSTPAKPKPSIPKPSGSGSVVDWLNGQGRDSSYAARAKLAAQHGIKGYTGTAAQNAALLAKLQGGAKPAGKSISQMATEVIAGKHGTGHSARQKSFGINAATYAKVRAEVNKRA